MCCWLRAQSVEVAASLVEQMRARESNNEQLAVQYQARINTHLETVGEYKQALHETQKILNEEQTRRMQLAKTLQQAQDTIKLHETNLQEYEEQLKKLRLELCECTAVSVRACFFANRRRA